MNSVAPTWARRTNSTGCLARAAEQPVGRRESRERGALVVIAGPPGARVYRKCRPVGDALRGVVADPVEGLALDLDSSGLGHGGIPVEEGQQCEARVVGDAF